MLKDASALDVIDLCVVLYTVHPIGRVEISAYPKWLDEALESDHAIIAWEAWCQSTDLRPKCLRCLGSGRVNYSSGGAVYMNAIDCPECQ